MHHIIYLSWATHPFSNEQLQALLQEARSHNTAIGVTGILVYGNNCFLQVLEGEEATVRELYEYIKQDDRHRDVTAYADKAVTQRAFAGWSMAFEAASPQQFDELVGYLQPANVAFDAARLPLMDIHLLDLLRSFTLP
ncbi:BLUF domain-containing protein [Hymenobacter sp. BT559]|uniref:BLUF domain-containing protein n=1 Tax=Hymenobacter sp. BT559 TaxID=2795729 RepID=UPI0018EB7BB0|nr:BLUF domain-containing protein [Hymenobacter sp. BT559]MBJ6145328.1 BLUF domain-containing protein [Hymenobacter sp. BT559]